MMLASTHSHLQLHSSKCNNVLEFSYFFMIRSILADEKSFGMGAVCLKKAEMSFLPNSFTSAVMDRC